MPSLQKFHANVARHVKLMNKNLCANLIRHEYIVTGRAKAKRAQSKIESFLSKAIEENKKLMEEGKEVSVQNLKSLSYLQPPDRNEIGSKIIKELSERYPNRTHGFTRIIKLEPRLGEDKAPMSVIELVDSEFEIKFWYTAKIVARLELQGLPLDDLTEYSVKKLTQFRKDGEQKFREAVETTKKEFFKYDPETNEVADDDMKNNLRNLPKNLEFYGGSLKGKVVASKKFNTTKRPERKQVEIPKSPFST